MRGRTRTYHMVLVKAAGGVVDVAELGMLRDNPRRIRLAELGAQVRRQLGQREASMNVTGTDDWRMQRECLGHPGR